MVTFVTFTIDLHNEVTPNKWTMVERGNPEGSAPNPLNYIIDRLLPQPFLQNAIKLQLYIDLSF